MDEQNLSTLVILHRVYGGITALGACGVGLVITLLMTVFGLASSAVKDPAPGFIGLFLGTFWGYIFLLTATHSILNFLCANWIRDRRSWVGVVIVSVINCLNMPLGVALAVFTLIVVNGSVSI